jgi:predicted aminopeptidase
LGEVPSRANSDLRYCQYLIGSQPRFLDEMRFATGHSWHMSGYLPLLVGTLALSGCGTGYLLQAARGQYQVSHLRQPIEKLLHSDATDTALKRRLAMVSEARDYASRTLGLPDNASYRSYSALARPFVVWNVVAAPELSVEPRRWCFLLVGCLSYRGYFREANAEAYAATLRKRGFDVMVGGVAAYSTLGRMADPVLDTMLRYDDTELVGTLFHELAHQVIYVANDTAFNEAFAMVVEAEGLKRWTQAHGQGNEWQRYQRREQQQASTVTKLAALRGELGALYGSALTDEAKRRHKRELMDERSRQILADERAAGFRSGYSLWLQTGLNNAHLAAVATYHDCVPAFERLLIARQHALPAFFAAVRELGNQSPVARRAFCAGD